MKNYYDHLNNLPDELQAINAKYWDYSGRPIVDHADVCAIIDLLNICKSYDEFKQKSQQFFFNEYPDHKLILAYSCYIAALKRIESELQLG